MSKGDDVLDNWEEIADEDLASTLVRLQSGQESSNALQNPSSVVFVSSGANSFCSPIANIDCSSPMKLLERNSAVQGSNVNAVETPPLDATDASIQPVTMVLHKTSDEYQAVNYEQPVSTQTVKILRRPTQPTEPRTYGNRLRQPIKTLHQREQEYAEARLRILGAATNPEDDIAASVEVFTLTTRPLTISTATTSAIAEPIKVITTTPVKSENLVKNNYNKLLQRQNSPGYNNRSALFGPPLTPPLLQSWSSNVGCSIPQSASALMATNEATNASATTVYQQLQPLAQQKFHTQDSILRLPRGPEENTSGFQPRQ